MGISATFKNIVSAVNAWPTKKKTALFSVVAMSIAIVVLIISWSQKENYHVLYSNVSQSDGGQIVQRLKEMKVPYRADSNSISVPADKVYDIRLQLASHGLPQGGGVGFELFDKTDFGTTDFVQKLNYTRALQGELARTIMSLSEIEQCRVHLVMPQKSLFVREREVPTASVLVKLTKGRTLSQGQVQGIVHLVSSSVEGLNPKNVSIIDDSGELLTQKADDIIGLSSSQLEYQHKYEKALEAKVMDMLEPVAGKGKVKVKISANIDFSRIEKTEERFDPDSQVIRSEQKNTEKSAPVGTGGVPGVASNVPGKSSQIISTQGQSEKKNETINYEINKVTSHVISPSGEIKRLSAAVIVDGTYTAQSGSKEKKYTSRSAEEIKYYEDLVKNAIGYTSDRGDEVKVTNIPFENEPIEEMQEGIKDYLPAIMKIAKYFTPLLAMMLFFIFVLRPLVRTLAASTALQPVPEPETNSSQVQIQGELNEHEKIDFSRNRLIEWAKKNPNQAADMIKTWIEEK